MEKYNFQPQKYEKELLAILKEVDAKEELSRREFNSIIKKYPRDGHQIFAKDQLVQGYYYLAKRGKLDEDEGLLAKIRMKPSRTVSGVVPVTILTRPFPCPGKCIFCPNDVRMPKSYLSDEPGAQRAERNHFDPYLQTYNRLLAYKNTGHPVSKIEIIILGGTWSYYPEKYQIWFIKRCFEALNDFGVEDKRDEVHTKNIYEAKEKSKRVLDENTGRRKTYNELVISKERNEADKAGMKDFTLQMDYSARVNNETATWEDLEAEQKKNETALSRCVGLVIETRPDNISEEEVLRIRRLGATKTQVGFQSLNDEVLDLNKRGHDVAATIRAIQLLRSAGFKIHGHWMANLYGSTPEMDKEDYEKLFTPDFQPDELKVYPCSLIETAELYDYYKKGLWKPFTEKELLDVLVHSLTYTPRYTRLTRVIRDIPSQDIVVGNKKTNFRQLVENEIRAKELGIKEIRAREIRNEKIKFEDLELKITHYRAKNAEGNVEEYFLEYATKKDDKICGFLRLSIPEKSENNYIEELKNSAIIREIHVYGQAQNLGMKDNKATQHIGLGRRLMQKAFEIAKENHFKKISVISAIGTREYYRKNGFTDGKLYQHKML